MSKYVDIRDLVRHIDKQSGKVFIGTKYQDSYLFYHDALSTMPDKDCLDWMEEEGILKRWIGPELGLNNQITIVDQDGNEKIIKYLGFRF